MKFGEITVKGQKFEVDVNQQGQFGANFPDGGFHVYPSLAELEQALIKHLAKATYKFAIPIAQWKGGKLQKGVATGLHARTNNVLVKWDDGSTEQMDTWRSDALRFPSPEKEAEFVHISEQAEAFESKRRALYEAYKFNVKTELKDALDKKVKEAEAKKAETTS